jgi:predicted PurR-regulated permease PerM
MNAGGGQLSPRWGSTTKLLVAMVAVVLAAALLVRFRSIIPLLVVALLLGYLLVPLVNFMHRRARLGWGAAANLTFLFLVLIVVTLVTAVGLAAVQQLQGLLLTLQALLLQLPDQLAALPSHVLVVGPWRVDFMTLDLVSFANQGLSIVRPAISQVSGLLTLAAARLVEAAAHLVFVLAVAYFIVMDAPRLQRAWAEMTLPRYESDFQRIKRSLGRIWHAFLRGQLLIVLMTGLLTTLAMSLLGVRYAVALGVLMGLAKLLPIVGPFTAGMIAALVALFQPAHPGALGPVGHASLVIVVLVVLDQGIDYFLLPRILGSSLNLHPVLILLGAIVGASLLGIVGLLLSAPTTATLILLGRYASRKLMDLPPWDPPIGVIEPATARRRWRWWDRSNGEGAN